MFVARNSTGHILRNRTRKSAAAVCCVGRSGHCAGGVSTKTERDCSPVSQGTTGAGPRALTTQGTFAPWLVGCVAGACGFRCHMNRLVGSLPVIACRIRTLLCRGSSSCPTSSPPLLRDYRGLVKSKRRPDPLGSLPFGAVLCFVEVSSRWTKAPRVGDAVACGTERSAWSAFPF